MVNLSTNHFSVTSEGNFTLIINQSFIIISLSWVSLITAVGGKSLVVRERSELRRFAPLSP